MITPPRTPFVPRYLTTAASFRNGVRRRKMPIRDRQSIWIEPLIREAGLRSVKALQGDGATPLFSEGGWEFVDRPRNKGFTTWTGQPPYQMTVPVVFDGFVGEVSQEEDYDALRRICRVPVGPQQQPSPVRVTGAIPFMLLTWVIKSLEPTAEYRRSLDGHRIRIELNMTLMEYVDADVIVRTNPSPAAAAVARNTPAPAPAAPPPPAKTRTYVVKRGDTLVKISQSLLGTYKRWQEIARLNGIRDPKKLKIGQVLKIPS